MSGTFFEGCSGNDPKAVRNTLASPSCLVDALANAIRGVSRQDLIEVRGPCGETRGKIFWQELLESSKDVHAAHRFFKK